MEVDKEKDNANTKSGKGFSSWHKKQKIKKLSDFKLTKDDKYLIKATDDELKQMIIKELNTSIIIVADGGLGTINSILLTVEYARSNGIDIKGIILNNFEPNNFMHQDDLKQVEYLTGVKVVATVEKGQKDIKLLENLFEV